MDRLEKYIRDHREAFDEDNPDDGVWRRLEEQLWRADPSSVKRRRIFYLSGRFKKRVAVAAVFFLGITFVAFVRTYQVKKEAIQQAIPPDLQEARAFYKSRIQNEIAGISRLRSPERVIDSSFLHLFEDEDTEYDRLSKALRENPDNPHVRAAFVEYYRSRLEVLKRIRKRLKDYNYSKE